MFLTWEYLEFYLTLKGNLDNIIYLDDFVYFISYLNDIVYITFFWMILSICASPTISLLLANKYLAQIVVSTTTHMHCDKFSTWGNKFLDVERRH